jgi:hypothetical protein
MRTYRKRPTRRGKSKPYTIHNPESASLLEWVITYPFMSANPRAWFKNWHISQAELKACYDAGWHRVALELGYQAYRNRQPLQVESKPIVATIPQAGNRTNDYQSTEEYAA